MGVVMSDLLLERETLTFLPAYEAPQSDLEKQIAGLIAEHFKLDKLGRNDDFFDLGGDSLAAVALAEGFEQRFGIPFQSGSLIEHSTVSSLALHIGGLIGGVSASMPECLTALQTDGDSRALFYVHGALGVTFVDKRFLDGVGKDLPLYFFQLPGLDGRSAPMTSVEQLATLYIDAMRAVQPIGPYRLAANCVCCLIGFEMARQLAGANEQVSSLVLVDPGTPPTGREAPNKVRESWRRLKRTVSRLLRLGAPERDDDMLADAEWDQWAGDFEKAYLNGRKKARKILDRLDQSSPDRLGGVVVADELSMVKALTLLRSSLTNFSTQAVYSGRVHMIVTQGRLHNVERWRGSLTDLVVHLVPGQHEDMFQANVATTTAAIRSALD